MQTNKRKLFWLSVVIMLALILSACGASSKEPTPTPIDANAIAATAIANFAMGLTQTAFAQPTLTFTPVPSPTNTLAPVTLLGTNTPSVAPTSSGDVSGWISDVNFPDGSPVAPGQQFTKKWIYINKGTNTWTANYKVAFGGIGSTLGGQPILLGKTVKPGEQVEISISFTAPTAAGDYESYWKIQNEKGEFFGEWLWVKIKVVGNTPTATEPPTETPVTPAP